MEELRKIRNYLKVSGTGERFTKNIKNIFVNLFKIYIFHPINTVKKVIEIGVGYYVVFWATNFIAYAPKTWFWTRVGQRVQVIILVIYCLIIGISFFISLLNGDVKNGNEKEEE